MAPNLSASNLGNQTVGDLEALPDLDLCFFSEKGFDFSHIIFREFRLGVSYALQRFAMFDLVRVILGLGGPSKMTRIDAAKMAVAAGMSYVRRISNRRAVDSFAGEAMNVKTLAVSPQTTVTEGISVVRPDEAFIALKCEDVGSIVAPLVLGPDFDRFRHSIPIPQSIVVSAPSSAKGGLVAVGNRT